MPPEYFSWNGASMSRSDFLDLFPTALTMPSPKKRNKNTATEEQLYKCIRAELNSIDPGQFLSCNLDKVVQNYKNFLLALLPFTLRPQVGMLEAAAGRAFPKSDSSTVSAGHKQ